MKMNFLRRLALLCAVLTCGMLLALPAAAAEADAPYAEDGDMDYIRSYVVTVDPRALFWPATGSLPRRARRSASPRPAPAAAR